MSLAEKITAAVDERERMLDAATPGPFAVTSWAPSSLMPSLWAADTIEPIERGPFAVIHAAGDRSPHDAALIVAAVNQQRVLIQHAREVVAWHDRFHVCSGGGWWANATYKGRVASVGDCPEIISLARAWGVTS